MAGKKEFFIDILLVRIHFIIVMIRWTDLAPWEFEFPFPGSLTSERLQLALASAVGAARSQKSLEEAASRREVWRSWGVGGCF